LVLNYINYAIIYVFLIDILFKLLNPADIELQKRDRIPGLGDDDSDEEAEEGDSYRIGLFTHVL